MILTNFTCNRFHSLVEKFVKIAKLRTLENCKPIIDDVIRLIRCGSFYVSCKSNFSPNCRVLYHRFERSSEILFFSESLFGSQAVYLQKSIPLYIRKNRNSPHILLILLICFDSMCWHPF